MPRKPRKRTYGSGSVDHHGASWRIRWREGGRQRERTGYDTRDTAERVLATALANIAQRRAGLPPDPKTIPRLVDLAEDWLDRRKLTHRSHRDDRSRWENHLKKFFGLMRPGEVTPAEIRRFAEAKLGAKLSSTTVGHCVRLLSVFFTDLLERGLAEHNPVRALPRATRRLMRNAHDPRTTPFLEKLADVRRVFVALPARYGAMFAIGALAGLRPGEVLGLAWADVDLGAGRIVVSRQVHRGQLGPVKDDEARVVPILEPLAPVLTAWKLSSGGAGLLFPPLAAKRGGRPGSPPRFVREHTLGKRLRKVLDDLELYRPGLNWYRCTRHTFASQWVIGGRSMEKLATILGHSSVTTTERYAHLRVDHFSDADRRAIAVDLSRPAGAVVELPARSVVRAVEGGLRAGGEEEDDRRGASDENHQQGPVAQVDRAAVS
jgi:integrase